MVNYLNEQKMTSLKEDMFSNLLLNLTYCSDLLMQGISVLVDAIPLHVYLQMGNFSGYVRVAVQSLVGYLYDQPLLCAVPFPLLPSTLMVRTLGLYPTLKKL